MLLKNTLKKYDLSKQPINNTFFLNLIALLLGNKINKKTIKKVLFGNLIHDKKYIHFHIKLLPSPST